MSVANGQCCAPIARTLVEANVLPRLVRQPRRGRTATVDIEKIRRFCLALPGTTEDIQWGNDLLFRVGGKIYAGSSLDAASPTRLSFKCAPEEFAELTERDGIVPAPYVARYHWVALERWDALSEQDIKRVVRDSYEMIRAKLPRSFRDKMTRKKARRR